MGPGERASARPGGCASAGCVPQRLDGAAPDSLLSVRDLSVQYGDRLALEAVDLDVRRGRVTALIGPSGCGKTSFLHALNKLSEMIPGCRVRGSVRFEGHDVGSGFDVAELRRRIGMVFQKPNPFPLSIRKNLELPLREHGCRRAELGERCREVLVEVGLWNEVADRLDAPALSLSGGQQQRLCIARALTLRPTLLLMDEPCSSLDPLATEVIEGLIGGLRGRTTVLIVTHNLAQARRVADDVALFWCREGGGCLIESGTAEQLFESPRRGDTRDYLAGVRG